MLYLHRDTLKLVRAWLGASGISSGRLFRSVRRDGAVGEALDESQVPRIYRAMAERAGLPAQVVRRISGHSPRVGAAQDMIASGIGIPAIMQAGRWKSASMVQRYFVADDSGRTRYGLKLSSGRTMGVGLEFGRRESVDLGPEDAMLLRGELRF